MVTFLAISKHAPESCPANNAEVKKMVMEDIEKTEEVAKKYGVKRIGGWGVPSEHLTIFVDEAPSLEAYQKFGMEFSSFKWSTTEIKVLTSMEEAKEMLK